ncbi:hypothetical protein WJX77_009623 [Trebouxia sp. C0004]
MYPCSAASPAKGLQTSPGCPPYVGVLSTTRIWVSRPQEGSCRCATDSARAAGLACSRVAELAAAKQNCVCLKVLRRQECAVEANATAAHPCKKHGPSALVSKSGCRNATPDDIIV